MEHLLFAVHFVQLARHLSGQRGNIALQALLGVRDAQRIAGYFGFPLHGRRALLGLSQQAFAFRQCRAVPRARQKTADTG